MTLCQTCLAEHQASRGCFRQDLIVTARRALQLLAEHTDWMPNTGMIPPARPIRRDMRICQTCGREHGVCVCIHNQIESVLMSRG